MRDSCPEVKYNRRVQDYVCSKTRGHAGPHIDISTGTRWGTPRDGNHPIPYGMKAATQQPRGGVRQAYKPNWYEQHCVSCCLQKHDPKTNSCLSIRRSEVALKQCLRCSRRYNVQN